MLAWEDVLLEVVIHSLLATIAAGNTLEFDSGCDIVTPNQCTDAGSVLRIRTIYGEFGMIPSLLLILSLCGPSESEIRKREIVLCTRIFTAHELQLYAEMTNPRTRSAMLRKLDVV